jgi:guanylate kinase
MSESNLYIVSAPSGAGKTSMLAQVRAQLENVSVAISHTTRAPREGESDGIHYHFVSEQIFLEMVENQAFVEHACVFDNYYGTSKAAIESLLEAKQQVVLEIDLQGARQVRAIYPQAKSIFILPPSIEILEQRLQERGQDSAEVIADRMQQAREEVSHYDEYDYLLINDDLDLALERMLKLFTHPQDYAAPDVKQLADMLS